MELILAKNFTKKWDGLFNKHPIFEAFTLSIVVHIFLFTLLWISSEIYCHFSTVRNVDKIIEIEFVK